MAFLRFNRDKRGYEHFYLVEATTNRRGKTRARVLYWFRTPPNLKIGREPFDDEARSSLESNNPGVTFDWRKIKETPIPSAETERWRERRRAEKAEKAARRERAAGAAVDAGDPVDAVDAIDPVDAVETVAPGEPFEPDEPLEDFESAALDAAERQADRLAPTEESLVLESATVDPALMSTAPAPAPAPVPPPESSARRRRRRRRRGRGRPLDQGATTGAVPGELRQSSEAGEQGQQGQQGQPGEPGEPSEPGE